MRAQRLYNWWGFAEIGIRRGYYQPSGADAIVMRRDLAVREAEPEPADCGGTARQVAAGSEAAGDRPLVLGIETSCDETGVGLVRGDELLRTRWPRALTSTPGSAASCPRSPAGRTWRRWCRRLTARSRLAGVRLRCRRDRGHGRSGPGGCAAGRRPRRQGLRDRPGKPLYGVNHLAAHVAVDQLEHGKLPAPAIALLVSGGHSSLLLVPGPDRRGRAARRDDRRCGGRGVR